MNKIPYYALLVLLLVPANALLAADSGNFEIGSTNFLLNGNAFQIRCGEVHFARIPREYWAHRLRMVHAMGLNTVCAYLFWDIHEPEPGNFNFSGNADVAEFCRAAQREGLKVVLRPGPYACAEWDFGGLPYWLLKNDSLKVRTQDAAFMNACHNYLLAVGRQLAPLQISRGGPIIMVQVENEYGGFGNDRLYLLKLRDYLKEAGFDVPFFTCDPPECIRNDASPDIFCAINFGKNPEANFKLLREIRPTGPLMVSEYYPGWFDVWGEKHHLGDTPRLVREIGWMLAHDASFSIYMVHGGTTFGFNSGANSPPYRPQTSSYDYDAPISEAGWDTAKYHELRKAISEHLLPDEVLPPIPPRNPVIMISSTELDLVAPLMANLPAPEKFVHPPTFEHIDQSHGCVLYRSKLPAGEAGTLKITEVHDYALIFIDGKRIGTLDRRNGLNSIQMPVRTASASLDILVEAMGRVNVGPDLLDHKGITDKVELISGSGTNEIENWAVFKLPLDDREISLPKYQYGHATNVPAFYHGTFYLKRIGDTFLDVSSWTKGVVWVNGHNLGRYWNIGPQQTLYCPAPWLKTGKNEIIVFELENSQKAVVTGLDEPILDDLKIK
ncbi:MAG: beta-galactosidase [Verrucomicrobiae bacterium]|nr:beta-galactosidase [Verrucomicrobiae bacterium]